MLLPKILKCGVEIEGLFDPDVHGCVSDDDDPCDSCDIDVCDNCDAYDTDECPGRSACDRSACDDCDRDGGGEYGNGSSDFKEDCSVSGNGNGNYPGEYASPIIGTMTALKTYVKEHTPEETNKTCGIHVHISVEYNDYQSLMSKAFWEAFMDFSDKLVDNYSYAEELKTRVDGKEDNGYCMKEWRPESQITGSGGRYTHLNYSAYSKFGTLEMRMLPTTDRHTVNYGMVKDYLKFVSKWLTDNPSSDIDIKEDIVDNLDYKLKEELICV